MPVEPFQALACPLDGEPLSHTGAAWRCPAGHNFDTARQGYIHLLPVQNKRSLHPGDSKEMVAARQRFLNGGFYQPVADAVNRLVLAEMPDTHRLTCLDAGCGEGYYLRQLAAAAAEQPALELLGVDISKWAVLAAAKQDKHPAWVVGTNARLPVLSSSVDRVLCVFGFPVYAEFARVLKPGGQLLQVDAGPAHLRELREIIYPTLKPEKSAVRDDPVGFRVLGSAMERFVLTLDSQERIADLLAMTPHLYRATAEGLERAVALQSLTVTVDVRLTRYQCTLPNPSPDEKESA
ncbi:putative RNA methyltransferase [Marinobacter goseongensis]|jgi:23S rRNA (guanine745-N1)-methyltransferase|uniref:putative RNA methyltransferase n=1 Tax=Marinobacter goseongensis TaxID=453838 RepID=UPI002005B29D|nr:methyltransferase domain-containing protein [Marinobacter goseongensis]MCK7552440.1 methyltransferase domain-containing protein [Marinobacter goseongensis]